MIYYRKNTDPEMPLPEDFDILFFGESGGRRKSKKTIKLIAVISAVCSCGRYDFYYPSQCEKAESVSYGKTAYRRNRKAGQKFSYACRSGCGYGNFTFDFLPKP